MSRDFLKFFSRKDLTLAPNEQENETVSRTFSCSRRYSIAKFKHFSSIRKKIFIVLSYCYCFFADCLFAICEKHSKLFRKSPLSQRLRQHHVSVVNNYADVRQAVSRIKTNVFHGLATCKNAILIWEILELGTEYNLAENMTIAHFKNSYITPPYCTFSVQL